MKMKESRRKKTTAASKNFLWKEGFYKAVSEDWLNRFDELQVIDSSNNEGTNSRVTGKSGRNGWFLVRGRTNGAIKLAMAGS